MKNVKVLGIIPARGGSTSIKYKNIAKLGGKPLIYYAIREAKKSKLLDAFIVSTDSPKIAAVAKKYGADIPFVRPSGTAQKFSVEIEYQQHALWWLEKYRGWRPELVVLIKPTAPLRDADLIDKVIKVAQDNPRYSMVRTVSQPPAHPYRMWTLKNGSLTLSQILPDFVPEEHLAKWGHDVPRQKLTPVYVHNAAVDVLRAADIKRGVRAVFGGPIGGVITDPEISVDIDEPRDLELVAQLLKKQRHL